MKGWYAAAIAVGVAAAGAIVLSAAAAAVLVMMGLALLAAAASLGLLQVKGQLRRIYLGGLLLRFLGTVVAYEIILPSYQGGDALSYYRHGSDGASALLMGRLPDIRSFPGTGAIDFISSVIQVAVPGPPMAVGILFALAGWLGCVLFCEALALGSHGRSGHLFMLLVMLLPSAILWPSIQGKDALVLLAVSFSLYGAGGDRRPRRTWMVLLGTGLGFIVRPHVAAVALAALSIARALEGLRGREATRSRSGLFFLALLVAVVLPLASSSIARLVPGGSFDDVVSTLSERASYGGSGFQRPEPTSPVGLLTALPYAYFRPTLLEARSPQLLISSLESTLVALMVLVSMATRRPGRWLRRIVGSAPHCYCLVMAVSGGLMLGLLGNFGLLVRQRVLFELSLLFLAVVSPTRSSSVSAPAIVTTRGRQVGRSVRQPIGGPR